MIKKFLLIVSAILIIIFSIVMPNLLLQIEDLSKEKEIFTKQKEERKIDVQAEKIYLVRFIHDIYELKDTKIYYDNKKEVSVLATTPVTEHVEREEPSDEIKSEISKIVTNDIIKEMNTDDFLNYTEIINTVSPEYTVVTCGLVKENEEWLGINLEEKTGKIISVDFPTAYLRKDVALQKQLENYAKYLDLDIIGDWKFNDNILKSEKAQLTIMLVEKGDSCMLTIAPIETYEEYVAEDTAIKREYKIVEKDKENLKK